MSHHPNSMVRKYRQAAPAKAQKKISPAVRKGVLRAGLPGRENSVKATRIGGAAAKGALSPTASPMQAAPIPHRASSRSHWLLSGGGRGVKGAFSFCPPCSSASRSRTSSPVRAMAAMG